MHVVKPPCATWGECNTIDQHPAPQIRAGNVLQLQGKLYVVTKAAYTQGHGRQLGNVTVGYCKEARTFTHTTTPANTCMYQPAFTYIHTYTFTHTYCYTQTHPYTHIHPYTHTHTPLHTHVHTATHPYTPLRMQLDLKEVQGSGRTIERKRPYDTMEAVTLDTQACQVLYRQGT